MSELARPPRIGVRRGATIPDGSYGNRKVELWAETDLPTGMTVEEGLEDLSQALHSLLRKEAGQLQAALKSGLQPPAVVVLDLDSLDWNPFKTKTAGY